MKIRITDIYKGCGKIVSAPFYHTILVLMIFCALFCSKAICAEPSIRGLWVVRNSITSYEKAVDLVNAADTYGYNVLFLQVRGRGDAFYKSYFVPGPEEYPHIPDAFDPLATVLELAHAKGIEVHAWFNMYLTWTGDNPPLDSSHLVNLHPSWFMVSVNGQSMADCPIDSIRNNATEGRYISPGLEEVKSHLSKVITEVLVTYDIDGVHLDYTRYPGREYDFNHRIRGQFSNRYGIDPVDIILNGEKVDPNIEYLEKWVDYRSKYIDEQIQSIARRIKLVNEKIRFSVAVKPSADEAYYKFGQNWAGWLNEGIIDFVVTMSYFPETAWVEDVMNDSMKKVNREKVVGGIGAYKLTPEETADQIKLMYSMRLLGYCIFSYNTFTENLNFAESLGSLVSSFDK